MRHDENARDVRAAARDGALIRDSNRIDGPRAPHSPRSPHDAVVSRRAVLALSALTAAGFAVIATIFYAPLDYLRPAVFVMVGMLIYRHRSNIERLIKGEEIPFGQSKPLSDDDDDDNDED